MQAQILAPAAVLILWSIAMLFWMAGTRLLAMKAMGRDTGRTGGGALGKASRGRRGQDLEGRIPDRVNWKAHNYTHLMEQPTIFYPAVVILAIMGAGAVDVALAWFYVAMRIVHSIYQATVNVVAVRFALFMASTLALLALALRAAWATLFFDPSLAAG